MATTALAVKGLLGLDCDDDIDLQPFLLTASAMMDRVTACASKKGVTIPDSVAERMEALLSAHYFGLANPWTRYKSKSTEKASATVQGETGKGLESSYFGQSAMDLDPSGCLRAIGKGNRVGLHWLGREDYGVV